MGVICRRARGISLAAILVSIGACGPPPEQPPTNAHDQRITDGVAYDGHSAVGMVLRYLVEKPGKKKERRTVIGTCTGTLIGNKTVLTAAHCLDGTFDEVDFYTDGFVFLNMAILGVHHPIAATTIHPAYDSVAQENDIALLELQSAPAIAPIPISTHAPWVGLDLTLIGYGQGLTEESGWKRIASNTVAQIDADDLAFDGTGDGIGNVCYGDSGGPALATIGGAEVQVGVNYGIVAPCGNRGVAARVDIYADWITTASQGDVAQRPPLVDTTPPLVAITTPLDGAEVPPDVAVRVDARDHESGVQTIELFVDGATKGSVAASAAIFQMVNLGAGTRALTATAFDVAGNHASTSITIEVLSPPEEPPPVEPPPEEPPPVEPPPEEPPPEEPPPEEPPPEEPPPEDPPPPEQPPPEPPPPEQPPPEPPPSVGMSARSGCSFSGEPARGGPSTVPLALLALLGLRVRSRMR